MNNDIIFARKITVLCFKQAENEYLMAALPLLHVVQQHFIKQFLLCNFVAQSQKGTAST